MSEGIDRQNDEEKERQYLSAEIEMLSREPETLEDFRVGNKITRENFLSFITLSFTVSRGRPEVQRMFFQWLEHKFGFDWESTITAFEINGAWDALSEQEQETFMRMFERVARHKEAGIDTHEQIVYELQHLGARRVFRQLELVKDFFDFDNINSLRDFNKAAINYFAWLEEKKRKSLKEKGYHVDEVNVDLRGQQHI